MVLQVFVKFILMKSGHSADTRRILLMEREQNSYDSFGSDEVHPGTRMVVVRIILRIQGLPNPDATQVKVSLVPW